MLSTTRKFRGNLRDVIRFEMRSQRFQCLNEKQHPEPRMSDNLRGRTIGKLTVRAGVLSWLGLCYTVPALILVVAREHRWQDKDSWWRITSKLDAQHPRQMGRKTSQASGEWLFSRNYCVRSPRTTLTMCRELHQVWCLWSREGRHPLHWRS
jgi:hypothetical protein